MARNLALKQAIVSKDLKYWEVAELAGCKELDICKIVTGRIDPSYGLACRISEVVGVNIKDLFPNLIK